MGKRAIWNIDLEKPHDLQKICSRSKGSPKSWKKCPRKKVSLISKSESDIGNLPDLEVKKSPIWSKSHQYGQKVT